MNLYIETSELSADTLGELLRELFFVGNGLGCYETFEVGPNVKTAPACQIEKFVAQWNITDLEVRGYHRHFLGNFIQMFYWWDGDGTLVFVLPDRTIHNSDCKKNYNWKEGYAQ